MNKTPMDITPYSDENFESQSKATSSAQNIAENEDRPHVSLHSSANSSSSPTKGVITTTTPLNEKSSQGGDTPSMTSTI